MKKIKYLFKRIFNLNYKNMFDIINKVQKKNGKSKIYIFFDMIICGLKYMAGYMDYYIFGMYNLKRKQRKTVLTRGKNDRYIKLLNNKDYWHFVHNKNEFNEKFAKYLKRDWLFLTNDKESFIKFIKDKDVIIAKPQNGTCGKGIEKIKIKDYKPDALFKYLTNKKLVVLEELIHQHSTINKLHPYSVNTIRTITILKKGIPHVVAAYMRIGNGKVVDNFNSGGMVVPVNVNTGVIKYPALDKAGNLYKKHPLTNINIIGFKVPLWEASMEMVKEAAKVIPELGIMGWDVAITNEGPLLIEANQYPGHDIYQLPPHTTNGIGMLPTFEAVMKTK
ncbi:MAG: sugar-transfer associated ATP-grasp domain-containing protein [Bacilli bacterium]|nr:sugar-transfer associated ATP-grasp domain-containing protein [Bacilli bacterium]